MQFYTNSTRFFALCLLTTRTAYGIIPRQPHDMNHIKLILPKTVQVSFVFYYRHHSTYYNFHSPFFLNSTLSTICVLKTHSSFLYFLLSNSTSSTFAKNLRFYSKSVATCPNSSAGIHLVEPPLYLHQHYSCYFFFSFISSRFVRFYE